MFGVTHVAAIDGFSGKIVSWSCMPQKNNLVIYEEVYRSAVNAHGLWDQVRVDHGTEFYLMLYMQEKNAHLRSNVSRAPYVQSQSTRNHRIERIWVEVNNRVNYPLKAAIIDMENNDLIDMGDNIAKFCTSNLLLKICGLGLERFFKAWNAHPVPGKGVPNHLALMSNGAAVNDIHLPSAEEAAVLYAAETGSKTLTPEHEFATNPFPSDESREMCESAFNRAYPNLHQLLDSVSNDDYSVFQNALIYLIDCCKSVCS